jgi:hypothetical protein
MASATDQQQEFLRTYAPLAQKVGEQLDVDPNIIIGQWAHETGYGTNQGAKHNNLGGFTAQDGNYFSYDSPEQFADHYVNTLKAKYPGAVDAGSDASKFSAGLRQGLLPRRPELVLAQNWRIMGGVLGGWLAAGTQLRTATFCCSLEQAEVSVW